MTRRLYDSVRWRHLRAQVLNEEPLCRLCARMGRDTAADTVDHIEPHKGIYEKFYDRKNLQALCSHCHGIKRRQDRGGLLPGCDIDGLPLDSKHWWNEPNI